jgi:hypothetical protein
MWRVSDFFQVLFTAVSHHPVNEIGQSLVLYHLVDKRQRFLQSSEIVGSITAYTSGPGKRCV